MNALAEARRDARLATRNHGLRVAARSGYVASALLRTLIGVLALLLAAHVDGADPDASGAFGLVAAVPGGVVLLAVVAGANAVLGLWLIVQGLLVRQRHDAERWRQRLVLWGRAAVYLVVGATATRVALGVRASSAAAEREAGRRLLDLPGGPAALALVGAVIVVVGIGMIWVGVRRRFVRTVHLPDHRGRRRAVLVLGVLGYVLQGVSIAVAGAFVLAAALEADPRRVGGFSDVLAAFADSGPGRLLLVGIGIGWIVAGVYAALRARIARLD